jgi:hypothetical protein
MAPKIGIFASGLAGEGNAPQQGIVAAEASVAPSPGRASRIAVTRRPSPFSCHEGRLAGARTRRRGFPRLLQTCRGVLDAFVSFRGVTMRAASTSAAMAGVLIPTVLHASFAFGQSPSAPAPSAYDARPPARADQGGAVDPTPAAPPSSAGSHSTAWVHLDGPAGVRLEQDLDSVHHSDWNTICVAPCDVQVDTALDYRVAGGLMKASTDFSLRANDGEREDIHIEPASRLWYVVGVVGVSAGSAVFVFGLFSTVLAPVLQGLVEGPSVTSTERTDGWIMVGAGAAAAVGGLVLMLTNRTTSVSQEVSAHGTAVAPEDLRRMPHWTDAEPPHPSTAIPLSAVGIPIFTTRF